MTKQKNNKPEDLLKDLAEAGQKVTKSYMDNLPNLLQSGQDIFNSWLTFNNSFISKPENSSEVENLFLNFYKKQIDMWRELSRHINENKKQLLPNGDKRFKSEEWNEYPFYFYFIKQTYLMASELMSGIIEYASIDDSTKKKLKFYMQLYLDAMSPSNFIATNPEVLKLAQQTKGESLMKGFNNLVQDLKRGRITQTDFSHFEVGKNLAITPGNVIAENELIQLIQYTPQTKKVYENPLLVIPPWINRYYILDLEPHNSFVKHAIEQGFTVFMISWRVPKGNLGKLTMDDYVTKGALYAIDKIREITGNKKVNALGYCIGGTLLGIVSSILSSKGKNYLSSASFLATMLDFSDFGVMSAVVDKKLVEKLEKEIGQGGILMGTDMTNAFNMIRANDLIWKYVINNYYKGNDPAPFSILYWTNDNTNLPGKMYTYYLKNIVIGNLLSKKNCLTICDTPIDLGNIDIPCYVLGTIEDHISPCHTTFSTTHLVKGDVKFVIGEAGHVAGIINPPSPENKYGYFADGELGKDLSHFKSTAKYTKESWWIHWTKWLKLQSGKQITTTLNPKNKIIEPAPGRYVKESLVS